MTTSRGTSHGMDWWQDPVLGCGPAVEKHWSEIWFSHVSVDRCKCFVGNCYFEHLGRLSQQVSSQHAHPSTKLTLHCIHQV